MKHFNPIIWSDFPDPDVIRVEDTFYMVSTTMHMMPGCVILRSYDLVNWEIASHVYDTLDATPGQRLEDQKGIYGAGMWAASLRCNKGIYYICFVANDTRKTYLYQSNEITGPWKKQYIKGFYHDCSLFFDDDERVYIVYGNRQIYFTELKADLSGPKEDGIHRMILEDSDYYGLGFEGCHLYRINGKYYLFMIHWSKEGSGRRQEACYMAESLEGEFTGGNILDDDMGYHNMGVAQGGIVDTPDGKWYGVLFQDHGAIGRIPILVPMHWEDDFPVFGIDGAVPIELEVNSTRPDYVYTPLTASDDFDYMPDEQGRISLQPVWQWNHEPDDRGVSFTERPGHLRIRTLDVCESVLQAKNSLTQRTMGPGCEGILKVDASGILDGDYAGLSAFQSSYAFIGITKENGKYYVAMITKEEIHKEEIDVPEMQLKVVCDFKDSIDEAKCFYYKDGNWIQLGNPLHMIYTLDHFMGYRFAISMFSTKKAGGYADFESFIYQ